MQEIFKDYRKDTSYKIERARLLSDNYKATIIHGSTKIDLSDYGLKTIKWEADDELLIRKPCTMKEKLPIIRRGGFNFDFSWDKNSPDLIMFMLDQNIAYLDGYNVGLDIIEGRDTNYNRIGQNLRTDLKYRSKVEKSDVNSSFTFADTRTPTTYITVKFDLLIEVQHFSSKIESYLFKNGVIYAPSQSTEENSSTISESMRAYFPIVEINSNISYQPDVMFLVQNSLYEMMQLSMKEEDLLVRDRIIINPDNKTLLNK